MINGVLFKISILRMDLNCRAGTRLDADVERIDRFLTVALRLLGEKKVCSGRFQAEESVGMAWNKASCRTRTAAMKVKPGHKHFASGI